MTGAQSGLVLGCTDQAGTLGRLGEWKTCGWQAVRNLVVAAQCLFCLLAFKIIEVIGHPVVLRN